MAKPARRRGRSTARLVGMLSLAVVLLGVFVATAVAASQAKKSTVTLQFWSTYNSTDKEASTIAKVVIPRFEKLNPGIKVVSDVYPSSGDELLDKFLAAAAAGDPPDVMRTDISWVPQLSQQGLLLELGNQPWYAATVKGALPGPLATTKWQGKAYALPLDTNTQALFWNKTVFAAAGLTKPPATMGELISDAKKLTDASKGQYGLGVDGTDIWNVAPYIWSMGGSFTNATYTKASGFMNGSKTVGAVQALLNLKKANEIGTDLLGGAGAVTGEQGFPKGQYAMYIDGPWAVSTFASSKPKPNYGIALVPRGAAGSFSTVGGEDVVVPSGGHNHAAAVKFAAFLDSPFAQVAMAKVGQMSSFDTDGPAEVKAVPYFAVFAQQLKTAKVRPVSPYYSKLDTNFSTELQAIFGGKSSVVSGLNTAAQQSDAALGGK